MTHNPEMTPPIIEDEYALKNDFMSAVIPGDVFELQPAKPWLIDKVLGYRDFALLYGASGSGKTFMALDMAAALVTGSIFAEMHKVAEPVKVIYLTDEGIAGLAKRVQAVFQEYGLSIEEKQRLGICKIVPQLFNADASDGVNNLIKAFQEEHPDVGVVIIDVLANAMLGGEENSNSDVSKVTSSIKRIIKEVGCNVVLIHHTGKNGEDYRGASSLGGALDISIHCSAIGETTNTFSVVCKKSKDEDKTDVIGNNWGFKLVKADNGSATVEWQKRQGFTSAQQRQEKQSVEAKLLEVMRANADQKKTAKEWGVLADKDYKNMHTYLKALHAKKKIQNDGSSRNKKWWYEEQQ